MLSARSNIAPTPIIPTTKVSSFLDIYNHLNHIPRVALGIIGTHLGDFDPTGITGNILHKMGHDVGKSFEKWNKHNTEEYEHDHDSEVSDSESSHHHDDSSDSSHDFLPSGGGSGGDNSLPSGGSEDHSSDSGSDNSGSDNSGGSDNSSGSDNGGDNSSGGGGDLGGGDDN